MRGLKLSLLVGALTWGQPGSSQQAADGVAPEIEGAGQVQASTRATAAQQRKAAGQPVVADNWMVVAAHPLATEAGADILRLGGTAADAMVAVQAVLGLVEPQSSGLGGGAFLVWYDAASGELTTLDGRETAPLAATPLLFQDDNGDPLAFFEAVVGGRSVGVPGTPALMQAAHDRWGNQDWEGLLDPAMSLAVNGFAVSPRLAASVQHDAERLTRYPLTASYFLPGGVPLKAGQTLRNVPYASSLMAMGKLGADVFYTGRFADRIVAETKRVTPPGLLEMADFAIYQVRERAPVCSSYRSFDVCGMGPPSSGALTIGQILGVLEHFDLAALGPDSPEAWRLIGDASRLAFADRARYMADSDFVPVPTAGLVDPAYLASRAEFLNRDDALRDVAPGTPEFDHSLNLADNVSIAQPSTSHISIVDSFGNALSMTTTIENAFGSRVMAGGFLLNNELTDFSFHSHRDGVPIANRVEPGKRPRSSMSPTIVLKDGKPVLIIGSPGGSRIIGYVAKTIIAHLDWGMDVQEAIALPHLVNRFGTYDLEADTLAETLAEPLTAMGFKVNRRALTSGIHAIAAGETLSGGADPRREGIALGE